jgi:hypothetical protein
MDVRTLYLGALLLTSEASMFQPHQSLPQLRFDLNEAAQILRMSRATLCQRVRDGLIKTQKDGRRSFIAASELDRYVAEQR